MYKQVAMYAIYFTNDKVAEIYFSLDYIKYLVAIILSYESFSLKICIVRDNEERFALRLDPLSFFKDLINYCTVNI